MPVSAKQYIQIAEERLDMLRTIKALEKALRDSEDELRVVKWSNHDMRCFIITLEKCSIRMTGFPTFDDILGRNKS